jgi:PASTA domain
MRHIPGLRSVAAALAGSALVLSGVAGCARSSAGASPPGCPGSYPVPSGSAGAVLVPAGALWVLDCGYGYPKVKPPNLVKVITPGPDAGPVVRGPAVGGYVLLLDRAPLAASGDCVSARSGSPRDALVFGYPAGRRLVLDWRASCPVLAGPGGRLAGLSQLVAEYLIGLSFQAGSPAGADRVPDVVGLSLDTAVRLGTRAGFDVTDDAELTSARPLSTVLAQGLAAGSRVDGGGFGLIVSAPPSQARCTAGQLRGSVHADMPGPGTSFATITLRDVSAAPCALRGTAQVTALGAAVQALSSAQRIAVSGPLVLTARAPASWPPPASVLAAEIQLSSLDFPGSCTGRVGHPTAWRVALAGTGELTLPVSPGQTRFPPVLICGRRVGVGTASLA